MYLLSGAMLVALLVYALVLQLGPRTLKVDIAEEQIATVTEGEVLEYIDVSGMVAPATRMGEHYRRWYGGAYLLPKW